MIALIEVNSHHNYVSNILDHIIEKGYNYILITNKHYYDELNRYTNKEYLHHNIINIEDIKSNIRLVIYTTEYIDLGLSCEKYMLVHNSNQFNNIRKFTDVIHLGSFTNLLKYISYLGGSKQNSNAIPVASSFEVQNEIRCDYVYQLIGTNYPQIDHTKTDTLHICVIGNINHKRKNYPKIAKMVSYLSRIQPVKLLVVGSGSDKDILKLKNQLKDIDYEIYGNEKMLSENETIQLMSTVDVIVNHMPKHIYVNGYIEKYGVTKISGSVYDSIYYNRPLLIFDDVIIHPQYSSSVIKWSEIKNLRSRNLIEKLISKKRSQITELRKLVQRQNDQCLSNIYSNNESSSY